MTTGDPSDTTVLHDPDDGALVVISAGRIASRREGRWQPGVAFALERVYSQPTIRGGFDRVYGADRIAEIVEEAEPWLRADAEQRPNRSRPPVDEQSVIGVDPEFGYVVVVVSGRAASYKDGAWTAGVAFSNGSLYEDFRQVSPAEAAWLIDEAGPWLTRGAG